MKSQRTGSRSENKSQNENGSIAEEIEEDISIEAASGVCLFDIIDQQYTVSTSLKVIMSRSWLNHQKFSASGLCLWDFFLYINSLKMISLRVL